MMVDAIAAIVFGILLLVVWNAASWPRVRRFPASEAGISVLIPARNEERNLSECLASAAQQGVSVQEILVYDDHSTDRTAQVVVEAAKQDPRIRLLRPEPLPEGWKGKPFACVQLAKSASCEWLLFLDADARLEPYAVPQMVFAAERTGASLVSFWPGLVLETAVEQWLMPMLNFVVFTLYPAPIGFRYMWPSLGLAHGACMLFRADTYHRLGGHGLVAQELFEDTVLARKWREQGERSLCFDGQDVVRVRMYTSLAEIWSGFRKNFYPAFRTETGFWLFLLFHAVAFLLPFAWAAGSVASGRPCAWAIAASAAVLAMRLIQCGRFRYPVWSALVHPTAEIALLALGISSWASVRSGRGVEWKGRRYGVS